MNGYICLSRLGATATSKNSKRRPTMMSLLPACLMHPFTAFVTKLLTFFSYVLCPNTDTIISTGILHVVVNHALDHFHIWFSRHFRNGSLGNTGTSIMLKCSSFGSEISRWRISLENVFFILGSSRHKIYHGIDLTYVDMAMRIAHKSHTCVVIPANESTFNDWRSFMIHEQQATLCSLLAFCTVITDSVTCYAKAQRSVICVAKPFGKTAVEEIEVLSKLSEQRFGHLIDRRQPLAEGEINVFSDIARKKPINLF